MTRYKTKADCGSCKRGGIHGVAAVYYGTGKNESGRPWRGYLCDNHAQVMIEDGAQIKLRPLRRAKR